MKPENESETFFGIVGDDCTYLLKIITGIFYSCLFIPKFNYEKNTFLFIYAVFNSGL